MDIQHQWDFSFGIYAIWWMLTNPTRAYTLAVMAVLVYLLASHWSPSAAAEPA